MGGKRSCGLLRQQTIPADVFVCLRLDSRDRCHGGVFPEQVGVALLQPQVVLDRQLPAYWQRRRYLSILGLEYRKYAGFLGQSRQQDRVLRGRLLD